MTPHNSALQSDETPLSLRSVGCSPLNARSVRQLLVMRIKALQPLLLGTLVAIILAPSVAGQGESSWRRQGARLSRSKPSVYISFLRFGKRESLHTNESAAEAQRSRFCRASVNINYA